MNKNFLKSIAIIVLTLQFVSCTSKSSGDEQQVTDLEAVEESNASVEAIDGGGETVENTVEPISPITENTEVAEPTAEVESLPSDPLAEVESTSGNVENIDGVASANESPAIAEPTPETSSSVSEPPTVAENTMIAEPPPIASEPPRSEPPVSNSVTSTPADSNNYSSLSSSESIPEEKPKKKENRSESTSDMSTLENSNTASAKSALLPDIQKIQLMPWRDGETLVNAVYFARPGDSFKSISKKIYGDSKKQSLLKKVNPGIESVKAGDAIYYSSINRPDDEAKVLTFAEDNGVAPETFVAQGGENIKTLSKKLLGYSSAWKEVLATNPQMSANDGIAPGMEIKFWNSSSVVASSAPKQNIETPPTVPMESAPTSNSDSGLNAQAAPPVEASPNVAANELPPPPPVSDNSQPPAVDSNNIPAPPVEAVAGNVENQELPPPPPPPAVVPQEPPVAASKTEEANEQPVNSDDSILNEEAMTLLLGAGIIAAAGVALVIIRKKRKNKELEEMLQNTQVG